MKLRLTVSFCILAALVAVDVIFALWAVDLARATFAGRLEPLAVALGAFLALGMGGAGVTAGQALLGRWVNEAASRRGDAV